MEHRCVFLLLSHDNISAHASATNHPNTLYLRLPS
jgi:hypothetical protein